MHRPQLQIKRIFLLFATGIQFLIFQPAPAQKKWSLEDCITYAFDHNIQIKQQFLNVESNGNNLFQSKMDVLPNMNANGRTGETFGRALDQTTYQFSDQTIKSTGFSVNSSMTLFSGLQQYNIIRQNEANLHASQEGAKRIKNQIALFIAGSYLQILLDKELLDAAKNQLEVTSQQVERTSKLVDAGSLPRGSLLEIQSQAASEDLQVINAQNNLETSYLILTQYLDLDSTAGFEIEVPELQVVDQPLEVTIGSVYDKAHSFLPQIKSAEYQLESARRNVDIARGARSPSLSLSTSYGSSYSDIRKRVDPGTLEEKEYPFGDQMKDNASTSLNLSINIPIFNGWSVNNYISNARIGMENSKLELENTQNQLYKDIQKAYTDAIAARKRYFATEQALVAMQESFRYTEEKFEVGLINTVDYNTEKNRLASTQSQLLQAKYDFIFKTKILDFYRGLPLSLK